MASRGLFPKNTVFPYFAMKESDAWPAGQLCSAAATDAGNATVDRATVIFCNSMAKGDGQAAVHNTKPGDLTAVQQINASPSNKNAPVNRSQANTSKEVNISNSFDVLMTEPVVDDAGQKVQQLECEAASKTSHSKTQHRVQRQKQQSEGTGTLLNVSKDMVIVDDPKAVEVTGTLAIEEDVEINSTTLKEWSVVATRKSSGKKVVSPKTQPTDAPQTAPNAITNINLFNALAVEETIRLNSPTLNSEAGEQIKASAALDAGAQTEVLEDATVNVVDKGEADTVASNPQPVQQVKGRDWTVVNRANTPPSTAKTQRNRNQVVPASSAVGRCGDMKKIRSSNTFETLNNEHENPVGILQHKEISASSKNRQERSTGSAKNQQNSGASCGVAHEQSST
ncbi:hypothetical protein A4A49_27455 [Nicotiana attenuata]|uniref:Uncharacterized protein n=1 Tax=Nicotiana attenuata TaxID=49451 RepID=A0A1J6L9B7_NICAT|nr:hypothetical protein A4A49_27455 [Nicotiana attenuata]